MEIFTRWILTLGFIEKLLKIQSPSRLAAEGKAGRMKEINNLTIDDVAVFENDEFIGIRISWSANIGFGALTIYRQGVNDDKWYTNTECMGKDFVKMVLDEFVKGIEVVE